jgi:translation initiation factor IF-3
LSSYSTKTHYLHLVSSNPPIVKLIEKKAQQEKTVMQEKKAKAKRARVMETSEVQITWESAKGDLMHKIALVRGILERGDRVEIAFIHKPANTGNLLTGAALKKVQESFPALTKDELAGIAREWKEDRVEPAMRVIYLEPTKEIRDEVLKKLDESADEKSRAKEAKKAERRAKEEERLKRAKARAG